MPSPLPGRSIASLQTVHAGVGLAAAERIGTSGASMGDEFVFSLLDDLAHVPETVIVFDDVETVRNGAVLDELAVLVEQAPAGIRVVLSSRSDPPLPLHRLRVRGELDRASPGSAEDVRGRRCRGDPASRAHGR